MFGTIFLFFFLTNKPFFQNLKFYLQLPDMGGGDAKQFRALHVRSSFAPPFQIPVYASVLYTLYFSEIDEVTGNKTTRQQCCSGLLIDLLR